MKSNIIPLAVFSLLFVMDICMVSGQLDPSVMPQSFSGYVFVNGNPAPDGWLVVARVDGIDVAGDSTENGIYGWMKVYDGEFGDVVEFFVNDVKGGEYEIIEEGGHPTYLNLSITGDFCGDGYCTGDEDCNACPQDCGQCSPPPSGGDGPPPGGGGDYTPSTEVEVEEEETCVEDWKCTDWLECINGEQKRVCTDQNNCGTTEYKPSEKQPCELKVSASTDECEMGDTVCRDGDVYVCSKGGEFFLLESCEAGCYDGECIMAGDWITGFLTGSSGMLVVGATIAVVLVLLLIFFLRKR